MSWVLVCAGEVSGDIRFAEVLQELKRLDPGLKFFGIGGDRMAQSGVELLYHVRDFAFLGLTEIVRHVPFLRRAIAHLTAEVERREARLAVLVDYPGFNLRLARRLKAAGCRVVYYIGPQVWAWAPGRLKRMRSSIDHMIVILPFEEDIYRRAGIPVRYVGHPLADRPAAQADRTAWLKGRGLPASSRIIGLLPGSREQEISRLLPDMMEAARLLRRQMSDLVVLISRAPGVIKRTIEDQIPFHEKGSVFVMDDNPAVLSLAHAALVASGTSTLEAAWHGTPLALVYRVSWPTYLIGRLLVRIPWIGLVNVVAGRPVAPEFVQGRMRPDAMAECLKRLLTDHDGRREMLDAFEEIKRRLGSPGAAGRAAAAISEIAGQTAAAGD